MSHFLDLNQDRIGARVMFELIRKTLLASLGAAVLTKEKIDKVLQGFVDQGKLSREEADTLAEELIESGERQWGEIQNRVVEIVKKALDNLDIGSKREFVQLQERVENLEKRIKILEDAMASDTSEDTSPAGGISSE